MRLTVALGLLSLAACSTFSHQAYEGDPRPEDEVARVRVVTSGSFDSMLGSPMPELGITRVDGREVDFVVRVEMLPGDHRLELLAAPSHPRMRSLGKSVATVDVRVEAGDRLKVRPTNPVPPIDFLVIDEATNELVHSTVPSYDELPLPDPAVDMTAWDVVHTQRSAQRRLAQFVPKGESQLFWTARIELDSIDVPRRERDVTRLADASASLKRESGVEVAVELHEEHWVEDAQVADPSNPIQWAVTVARLQGPRLYVQSFSSQLPFDRAQRDAWVERFMSAALPAE